MSAKYAGGWLRVIPSKALSLNFTGPEYIILLQWWLGLPLIPKEQIFQCLTVLGKDGN